MTLRGKKKYWISLIILIVVAVVAVRMSGEDDGLTSVQADLALIDDISEVVTASGRVQPQTKVDIAAEVSAQIMVLYVKESDYVTVGQSLLLLDTAQLRSDVAQASYNLDEISARREAARTQFERDKIEYDRQKKLYEQNLTSETAYTDAKFDHESSAANLDAVIAQVNTAQARLEKAQDNLSKTTIVAPMEGIVTFLNAEVGEIAQAQTAYTQGKTLMTISDLSAFEVGVDVDETEIAKVRLGQTAKIRVDALSDVAFEGSVVEIGNSAAITGQGTDNYATNFRVKVSFSEANESIRPGMSAAVDITTAYASDALLIPYASIVTREFDPDSLFSKSAGPDSNNLVAEVHAADLNESDDDNADSEMGTEKSYRPKKEKIKKTGIFMVKDGKAVFKEVTTGIADDRNLVVLSGLNPGDTIVSGTFQTLRNLKEGEEVRIDEASKERMEDLTD